MDTSSSDINSAENESMEMQSFDDDIPTTIRRIAKRKLESDNFLPVDGGTIPLTIPLSSIPSGYTNETFSYMINHESSNNDAEAADDSVTSNLTTAKTRWYTIVDFLRAMSMNPNIYDQYKKHVDNKRALRLQMIEELDKKIAANANDNDPHGIQVRLAYLQNGLTFDGPSHQYTYKNNRIMSVTQYIEEYFFPFNTDAVIDKMMNSRNWPYSYYYNKFGKKLNGRSTTTRRGGATSGILRNNETEDPAVTRVRIKTHWDNLANAGTMVHSAIEKYNKMLMHYNEKFETHQSTTSVNEQFSGWLEKYVSKGIGKVKVNEPHFVEKLSSVPWSPFMLPKPTNKITIEPLTIYDFLEPQYSPLDKVLNRRLCLANYLQFDDYIKKKGWKLLAVECRIYDPEFNIAGCVDAVYQTDPINNPLDIAIVDWKTCAITTTGFDIYDCKSLFADYPKCKYIQYSMQLGLYARPFTRVGFNVTRTCIVGLKYYIGAKIGNNTAANKNDHRSDDDEENCSHIYVLQKFAKRYPDYGRSSMSTGTMGNATETNAVLDVMTLDADDENDEENKKKQIGIMVDNGDIWADKNYSFKIYDAINFDNVFETIEMNKHLL